MMDNLLNDPVEEYKPAHRKRRFTFSSYRLDYYSFAVDLSIEPDYWTFFIVRIGRRTFKWEWTPT